MSGGRRPHRRHDSTDAELDAALTGLFDGAVDEAGTEIDVDQRYREWLRAASERKSGRRAGYRPRPRPPVGLSLLLKKAGVQQAALGFGAMALLIAGGFWLAARNAPIAIEAGEEPGTTQAPTAATPTSAQNNPTTLDVSVPATASPTSLPPSTASGPAATVSTENTPTTSVPTTASSTTAVSTTVSSTAPATTHDDHPPDTMAPPGLSLVGFLSWHGEEILSGATVTSDDSTDPRPADHKPGDGFFVNYACQELTFTAPPGYRFAEPDEVDSERSFLLNAAPDIIDPGDPRQVGVSFCPFEDLTLHQHIDFEVVPLD